MHEAVEDGVGQGSVVLALRSTLVAVSAAAFVGVSCVERVRDLGDQVLHAVASGEPSGTSLNIGSRVACPVEVFDHPVGDEVADPRAERGGDVPGAVRGARRDQDHLGVIGEFGGDSLGEPVLVLLADGKAGVDGKYGIEGLHRSFSSVRPRPDGRGRISSSRRCGQHQAPAAGTSSIHSSGSLGT